MYTGIVTRRPLVLQLQQTEDGSQEYAEFLHMPKRRFSDFGANLTLIFFFVSSAHYGSNLSHQTSLVTFPISNSWKCGKHLNQMYIVCDQNYIAYTVFLAMISRILKI
jgi:hypothetical protein